MTIIIDEKAARERCARLMTEAGRRMLDSLPETGSPGIDRMLGDLLRRGMERAASMLTPEELADFSAMTDEEVIDDLREGLEPEFRERFAGSLVS